MSLSDQALAVLAALWDEQDQRFLLHYRDLLASWRDYALTDPDAAIQHGLPWAAPLRALIEKGTISGAADMLSLFAVEAGLTGGTGAIMHTIADHYRLHSVQLAGDLDGSVSTAAKNAAQLALETGMSAGDAAGLLLRKYETLGAARVRTIARTELTNGAALARIGAQAAAGFTTFEYRSILDEVTTRICTAMNHVVLDMLDPLARQLCCPNHYNCRSLLVPAAPGARGASSAQLRALLDEREREFPGWGSRLAPTIGRLVGLAA